MTAGSATETLAEPRVAAPPRHRPLAVEQLKVLAGQVGAGVGNLVFSLAMVRLLDPGAFAALASFGARSYKDTKKMYGNTGNSFVAVVEFGDKVRAKAVSAGGESGDPKSKHFKDQAERYSTGNLREVYFYPAQLTGHTERQYHPGQ